MGIHDFSAIFDTVDTACKGYIIESQVLELLQKIHFVPTSHEHVQAAIVQACRVPGQVHKSEFLDVLEEIERRRSAEEQAYWDFQALDDKGTDRISLKDALLLFKEFHGERFSMYTWEQFLSSREVPSADVCFDEIRLWLCDFPQGEPATLEQIQKEGEKIDGRQRKFRQEEINSYKTLEDEHAELQEYHDYTQHHANRKLAKWKKQGVEAMLFDDGLEADDAETISKPTNQITLNRILEMLDTKYDLLREKLLMEMAKMASTLEGDQPEIYEQLCKQERQLRRHGNFEEEVFSLSGAGMPMNGTLLSLMGEIRNIDAEHKKEVLEKVKTMTAQGYTRLEISQTIQSQYMATLDGSHTCGSALCALYKRCKEEKEFLLSHVKSQGGSMSVLTMENSRLSRQQLLIGDEDGFPHAAIAIGIAERDQEYKSDRLLDWDRIRCEKLGLERLSLRKGRKQRRCPKDEVDVEDLTDIGLVNIQQKYVAEIVQKHLYEREALIHMLQGRDIAGQKVDAKSITEQERTRALKGLRNQHRNWKNSSSPDPKMVHRILLEAVALYYENRKQELQDTSPKISEEETNASVLGDLMQRQEVEFHLKIQEIHSKNAEEMVHLILTENKVRRQEHFDNIAYVILGTLEITEDEREYMIALDEKYDALRERVIIMGLRDEKGIDWKRMSDKDKRKEIKERKKNEIKLRGEGNFSDLDDLIGPRGKAKMLPSLRKLIGEEKGEFYARMLKQHETGVIQDEMAHGSFDPVNILADLVSRFDNEQEVLLEWLKRKDTKSLPIRQQRLKILQLRLETFASQMEEDFEVAARYVGLLERVEAVLSSRHAGDNIRQHELAKKRIHVRSSRLLHSDLFEKKVDRTPRPEQGDLTGWQMAYLREVILRHDDEREQMLALLQDDTIDDLTEAAGMMTEEEKKQRLAELHAKRRKLDLKHSDDQHENINILEEAVAIRFVCRRQKIESETRRKPNKEDVNISLLKELQEEQDEEIALILSSITDLEQEELENKQLEEREARDLRVQSNVFVVLLQSESKVHQKELLQALELKYESLKEGLINEALRYKHGATQWEKMSVRERQHHIASCNQQIKQLQTAGNNVGLIEIQGGVKLDQNVNSLMGMARDDFLQLISSTDDEEVPEANEPPPEKMYNALADLWKRFDVEKKLLMQKLKGLQVDYMSDLDQQIHLIRLYREKLLGCRDNKFSAASQLVGLAERQQESTKPRLIRDRQRYEDIAKYRMSVNSKKQTSRHMFTDEINRGSRHQQMRSVMELLELKHLSEQDYFTQLLLGTPDPALLQETISLSQQQKKDRLHQIRSQKKQFPQDKMKEHEKLFAEGIVVKKELCRHRLSLEQKAEAGDTRVNEFLVADLLQTQSGEAEKILRSLSSITDEELCGIQARLMSERKFNVADNVDIVVFSTSVSQEPTETDVIEALEGKYDALRDKLLADALMKQYGEAEWQRMSELERQRKLAEMKLLQKQLKREGKFDELSQILGDALDNQEALKKLMGDTKLEQERKMKERLQRRKQRLAKGMTEEECDQLEAEEVAKEEEEEKKKRRNILLDLEHRFEEEKAELLQQLNEGSDQFSKEKARQLQLMKLRRDERKARNEDKFESAALVLGLADQNEKQRRAMSEEERLRQQELARTRLEAIRKKRREGKTTQESLDVNVESTDKAELKEALNTVLDQRHQHERDCLIKILDMSSDLGNDCKQLSQAERDKKLRELTEVHRLWRQSLHPDPVQQENILKEAAAYMIASRQAEGENLSEDQVKVNLICDLQLIQDDEARVLLNELDDKDVTTLQHMIKHQISLDKESLHDNVSKVILGKTTPEEDEDAKLLQALEDKYDALKDKLLQAALIEEMGEEEWNKLSDEEKQKKLAELKMKEKTLREEGRDKEAAALFEKLMENDEVLDKLLGEMDKGDSAEERERRKEELKKEREEAGLPTDDSTLEGLLDQEEKEKGRKRRRNVLENLELMLEDEKAALIAMLKGQHNRIDQERQRQLAIAKLKYDQRRLKREDKLDAAALILAMGKEAEELHKQTILNEKERNKALAKERLEARRQKRKQKAESIEEKLRLNDEKDAMNDAVEQEGLVALHSAILDAVDLRQAEERDALLDLISAAQGNTSLIKSAKKMNSQELKTQLTQLEQVHKNWKKTSQQVADVQEDKLSKQGRDKLYKDVAVRRQEQRNVLSDVTVFKLELERQQNPALSEDDLSLTLLANLQEKQNAENRAIRNLLEAQEEATLIQMKQVQRLGRREGWFDNLTAILFSLSPEEDTSAEDLQALENMTKDSMRELEEEKQALIRDARANNQTEEEIQNALRQLEGQQMQKKKRIVADMESQRQKILERVKARKNQNIEKETEQLTAMQMVVMAGDQQKQQQEMIEKEKSHQGNELQKRLQARRLARKRDLEAANQDNTTTEDNDRATSSESSARAIDNNPFAAMKREKTVVNVVLTDKDKDNELKKLYREQTNLRSRIQDQQKQQEEMLQRRLKQRQNKKEMEAQQLLSLGERQKTNLFNVKQDEKSRQMEAIQERVRGRSRSPNKASRETSDIREEDEKKKRKK